MSLDLTRAHKRQLRGLAHELKPVVHIGRHGATVPLIAQVEQALLDHELVKVRINQNNLDNVTEMVDAITGQTDAALVQRIGRVLIFFRPHPEEPRIQLKD